MYTIGIDIGGTSLRIGCVSRRGELTRYERVPQGEVLTGDSTDGLAGFLQDYIRQHSLAGLSRGVAVGLPGTISREKDTVLNCPNVTGLNGVRVGAALGARTGLPVFLLKDVTALYYHDRRRFAIPRRTVTIACYIGTGIGNVIDLGGALHEGANGAAGELGHIPVWDSQEPCGCGNTGCAEMHVGGKYLARLHREAFPDTPIDQLFVRHGGHPLLLAYIRHLAVPIATEINILDPQTVILGGGVVSMPGFPADLLEEAVRGFARKPLPEANLAFIVSDNGGENGVIGAGIYAWEKCGGHPLD